MPERSRARNLKRRNLVISNVTSLNNVIIICLILAQTIVSRSSFRNWRSKKWSCWPNLLLLESTENASMLRNEKRYPLNAKTKISFWAKIYFAAPARDSLRFVSGSITALQTSIY